MPKIYYSNPSLYLLQSKYAQNNFQGNSRWLIVNPLSKKIHGAIGKDSFPAIIDILCQASEESGVSFQKKYAPLIENGLLIDEYLENGYEKNNFLTHYHQFVEDYPFHDYSSPERWGKDKELMYEYGNINLPPPVHTDWSEYRGTRVPLPPPIHRTQNTNSSSIEYILATALSAVFQASGSISGGDFGPWLRKICPSGGARHPTEPLLFVSGLAGIDSGIYRYDASYHNLVFVSDYSTNTPETPHIYIGLISCVERPMWRYREARSLRPVLVDAGHVATSLSEVFNRLGYSLLEHHNPALFKLWDSFDSPLLKTFRLFGDGLEDISRIEISNVAYEENYKIHDEFKTNPFVWCKIFNGAIWANTSYPNISSVEITRKEFIVLNYSIPSKRGDRKSSISNLCKVSEASHESVEALIKNKLLVHESDAKNILERIHMWCQKGWYQSLLAYTEIAQYMSECRDSSNVTKKIIPNKDTKNSMTSYYEVLREHRGTIRNFTSAQIPNEQKDSLFHMLSHDENIISGLVDVSYACFDSTNSKPSILYKYGEDKRRFVESEVVINQETAFINTIGQHPIKMAPLVIWLHCKANTTDHFRYMNGIISLGMTAQLVSDYAAFNKIGMFMTPAVHDTKTKNMLEISSDTNPMFYVVALGQPLVKPGLSIEFEDGVVRGKSNRLHRYEELLMNNQTLYKNNDNSDIVLCNTTGKINQERNNYSK